MLFVVLHFIFTCYKAHETFVLFLVFTFLLLYYNSDLLEIENKENEYIYLCFYHPWSSLCLRVNPSFCLRTFLLPFLQCRSADNEFSQLLLFFLKEVIISPIFERYFARYRSLG